MIFLLAVLRQKDNQNSIRFETANQKSIGFFKFDQLWSARDQNLAFCGCQNEGSFRFGMYVRKRFKKSGKKSNINQIPTLKIYIGYYDLRRTATNVGQTNVGHDRRRTRQTSDSNTRRTPTDVGQRQTSDSKKYWIFP